MGTSYQRKTRRSRRKMQDLASDGVRVEVAEGKASFQMVLPMSPLLSEVAGAIEQTATQAGLLRMKALIDEEVEQIAGTRYGHQADRQATRWGHDEGQVIYCGRKVAMRRPRVRSVEGREVSLQRYQAFQHPERMQAAVSQRILRRVSTRDYAGGPAVIGRDPAHVEQSPVCSRPRHFATSLPSRITPMMNGFFVIPLCCSG